MDQAGNCKFISVWQGTGGATYATAVEAQNAIAMLNGSVFQGAYIECDVWTEKPKTDNGKGKGKAAPAKAKGKGKWK